MKQTYTREKKTLCGERYMEVDLYPITPEEHAAKRRKKGRPSSERQKKRNGIARTEQSSVQEKEQQAAEIFLKERKYKSNTWKETVDKKEIGSHDGNGEIASKSGDSRVAIRSQSTVAGGEKIGRAHV